MRTDDMFTAAKSLQDAMRPRTPDAVELACPHTEVQTLSASTGSLDDHETLFERCYGCGGYFVSTVWYSRADDETAVETRPMTPAETARYALVYHHARAS